MFGRKVLDRLLSAGSQSAHAPGSVHASEKANDQSTGHTPMPVTGGRLAASTDGMTETQNFPPVILFRSAMESDDSADKITALLDFVNFVQENCHYVWSELSPRAMQTYYADYYEYQVLNGGHAQFLHNSLVNGMHMHIFAYTLNCLRQLDIPENLAIFEKFVRWFLSNRARLEGEYSMLDKDEDDKAFLDELDRAFYDLPSGHIRDHSTQWMKQWPELMIVDDDVWEETIRRFYPMGEFQKWRAEAKILGRCEVLFDDPRQVAASIMAAGFEDAVLAVHNGLFLENGGIRWSLSMLKGEYYLDDLEEEYVLRELIPGERPEVTAEMHSLFGSKEKKDIRRFLDLLKDYTPNRAGDAIGRLSKSFVNDLIEAVKPLDPAAHYSLMLKKLPGWDDYHLAWKLPDDADAAHRLMTGTGPARNFTWRMICVKDGNHVPFVLTLDQKEMVAYPANLPWAVIEDRGFIVRVSREETLRYRQRIQQAMPKHEEPVLL